MLRGGGGEAIACCNQMFANGTDQKTDKRRRAPNLFHNPQETSLLSQPTNNPSHHYYLPQRRAHGFLQGKSIRPVWHAPISSSARWLSEASRASAFSPGRRTTSTSPGVRTIAKTACTPRSSQASARASPSVVGCWLIGIIVGV